MDEVRLDRWLWAARCFKSRSQAGRACREGNILVEGAVARASRLIRGGEQVEVLGRGARRTLRVDGLHDRRSSAAVAATLFTEVAFEKDDDLW
jgi:ribosome-associated heat shock protein Hsp15